jgi:hypothetical protein
MHTSPITVTAWNTKRACMIRTRFSCLERAKAAFAKAESEFAKSAPKLASGYVSTTTAPSKTGF